MQFDYILSFSIPVKGKSLSFGTLEMGITWSHGARCWVAHADHKRACLVLKGKFQPGNVSGAYPLVHAIPHQHVLIKSLEELELFLSNFCSPAPLSKIMIKELH